ncbi:hypothetical protein P154DRAFT_521645 [Amniculicola lignicola CBS 123094]|uniref:DUF1772-domain-containing protein n=1 Tax=Amniculicola lignicola CBS 123094 TaxID=1392246 RepID=A0A6A5WIU5_9PLEO|nr:hypothetical protein P154DRAFT_521645 [Amniculicola lignicola CBS 123094]
MSSSTISICKFVGTISLGLLTGVSATLSTLALPALLTLPTAPTANTALVYLNTRSTALTSYLRHITTFTLFSAYLLSPRRFRHPYLLYTAILTSIAGPGVDYAVTASGWQKEERRAALEREAASSGTGEEDVNGEQVRLAVDRLRVVEGWRGGVAGLAFAMGVIGLWGDGA